MQLFKRRTKPLSGCLPKTSISCPAIFVQTLIQRVAILAALVITPASVAKADSAFDPADLKYLDINGYTLEYVDKGRGEPIVFVHGAVSDVRTWHPYAGAISENARFVSYSRRHYGTQDWPHENPTADDQKVHANDLSKLIESLDAGPVHLVSWSNSGKTLAIFGATRPELIKSITQYEPVVSNEVMVGIERAVEPGKAFGSGWAPVAEAIKDKNLPDAGKKLIEHVFEMPAGGFATIPKENQQIVLDNARTIPLIFNDVTDGMYTCDYLGKTIAPTLVVLGENTNDWWSLMSNQIADCHQQGQLISMAGVNHNGPMADVAAFSDIILKHVKKNR